MLDMCNDNIHHEEFVPVCDITCLVGDRLCVVGIERGTLMLARQVLHC